VEESTEFIIKQTITEHINVDEDLKAEIRSFTRDMIREARNTLQFGLGKEKMDLIKIFFGAAVRSVGRDFQTTENEGRIALERVFESMRDLPQGTPDAAPLAALTPRVDDPDQGIDD
jgi:hypothetical protein